ncbi:MAG TPA: hypothetical protein VFW47_09015 [Phenylobacterium sp.]|nr:hypothetical protein [Phenylobacterium sp.]
MTDIEAAKRRLMIMLGVSAFSALIAVGALVGALSFGQDWLLGVFVAGLVVGFGAQIWFIVGFGRAKKGV